MPAVLTLAKDLQSVREMTNKTLNLEDAFRSNFGAMRVVKSLSQLLMKASTMEKSIASSYHKLTAEFGRIANGIMDSLEAAMG